MIKISGKGGRLMLGARLVARFDQWQAEAEDSGRYRLVASAPQVDPIWAGSLPICPLTCEVTLGHHRIRRSALILAGGDELILEVWKEDDRNGE
jgi:hypothetical protein